MVILEWNGYYDADADADAMTIDKCNIVKQNSKSAHRVYFKQSLYYSLYDLLHDRQLVKNRYLKLGNMQLTKCDVM